MAEAVEDLIQGVQAIRTQDDEATLMEDIQQAAADMLTKITRHRERNNLTGASKTAVTQIDTNLGEIEQAFQNLESEVTNSADLLRENIDMDSATKHDKLFISVDGKRVQNRSQNVSPEDDRFNIHHQALSKNRLRERCYFEVEVKGTVAIAVAYRNITTSKTTLFGSGENSWSFRLDKQGVFYRHNKEEIQLSPTSLSKVEVHLDQDKGVLRLISHDPRFNKEVKTMFNEPLYAGVWINSAEYGWCQFI